MSERLVSYDDVRQHDQAGDCWVIIHGNVYDLSAFDHPGGAAVILNYAGRDATTAFDEIHAPGIVGALSAEQRKGLIDPESLPPVDLQPGAQVGQPSTESSGRPELHSLISVHDFEDVARDSLSRKAWAFYSSAATDLVSHQDNLMCHRKLMLRPRVLRDVAKVEMRRAVLGHQSSAPILLSPAAMAKLAHPEGELAVARACGSQNIIQIISSNASYPLADIVAAGRPGQSFWLQVYVNSERHKTEQLLRHARELGIKAIAVTVDAPVPGKREADERIAAENISAAISGAVATNDKKGGGLGRVMAKYIDASLNWADLAWIRRVSGLPLVLKGIQTASDAEKAAEMGVEAIMLSNHGGRSLDTTQPSVMTLLEMHKCCPAVFERLEVYVDGGFTRGTDVLKAIALGATAVGIGRPWLYSLCYGQEGVEHLIDIIKDELEVSMKLSGITNVDQAHPGMVNTALLEPLIRTSESHPWIEWRPKARL